MAKTTRRDMIKTVGAGVVGLIVGVAGGYFAGSSVARPAKKEIVTVTKRETVTATVTAAGLKIPKEPLKIGAMYFMTGPFGTYGTMAKAGLELAIEEINAAGGILGRKLTLTIKDEADREHVVDNFVKMVRDEGAEFLVGVDSSGDSLKLIDTVEKDLRVPFIVTHAATPKLTECGKRKYIFRISMYEEPIDIAAAKIVAERFPDVKRVGNIGPDYSYGWDSWAVFSSVLKEYKPDVELLDPLWPKLGTPDFSSYIDKLIAMEPDFVLSTLWGGDAVTFIKQANAKGFFKKVKYYFNAMLGATDVLKALGDESVPEGGEVWGSGRYWFLYPPHDMYPLNKRFVENFHKKTGEYPPYVAATSYTAIYAIKEAIEKAVMMLGKWPDADDLIKIFEGLTVAGPMGAVYIRPDDHQGIYYVFWGRLTKGAPKYPHPILTDLVVFEPGEVVPPPFKTYVKCG